LGDDSARFSVCVKDHQAIERTARRKYGGNIVVIRTQITFAEGGHLSEVSFECSGSRAQITSAEGGHLSEVSFICFGSRGI
jgi:hypothetical protein